jgi:hypothetical protein
LPLSSSWLWAASSASAADSAAVEAFLSLQECTSSLKPGKPPLSGSPPRTRSEALQSCSRAPLESCWRSGAVTQRRSDAGRTVIQKCPSELAPTGPRSDWLKWLRQPIRPGFEKDSRVPRRRRILFLVDGVGTVAIPDSRRRPEAFQATASGPLKPLLLPSTFSATLPPTSYWPLLALEPPQRLMP